MRRPRPRRCRSGSWGVAEPVGSLLGEPHGAVGAGDDAAREAVAARHAVLGHVAVHGDAPDAVGVLLGEPQRAVRAWGDLVRRAVGRGDAELADTPAGR